LTFPDGLREQLSQLSSNRNASGLPCLAGGLVLTQDDRIRCPINVGNRRPAKFTGTRRKLAEVVMNRMRRVWYLATRGTLE
jgi:hypothetical protein